ncbi:hypothetical protein BIW11_12496, partial [Tropilaelaps mercedesae]
TISEFVRLSRIISEAVRCARKLAFRSVTVRIRGLRQPSSENLTHCADARFR